MSWWQWLIVIGMVVSISWGTVFWLLERRTGTHKQHYSDGCAKPIIDRPLRADGSRKNIIPRPGGGEIDDLEHLLEHEQKGHDR